MRARNEAAAFCCNVYFFQLHLAAAPKLTNDRSGFYTVCLWTSIYQPYEHLTERNGRNLSSLIQSLNHRLYSLSWVEDFPGTSNGERWYE